MLTTPTPNQQKWRWKTRLGRVRPSTLVCTLIVTGLFVYLFLIPSNVYHYPVEILGPWSPENDTWLPEPNQACMLPRLDPFHESILAFVAAPVPIQCTTRLAWLTYVDVEGVLRFNDSALRDAGYSGENDSTLRCEYSGIYRKPGGDDDVELGPAKKMTSCANRLDSDFVRVRCSSFLGFIIYENYHVYVKPVNVTKVLRRRDVKDLEASSSKSQEDHQTEVDSSSASNAPSSDYLRESNRPNVIVLGIDSISRSNFVRQLPLTRRYLMSELGAVELRGYTKVGDNTYPNLVPMLTGLPHDSPALPSTKEDDTRGISNGEKESSPFYDTWPCVWKEFESHGYATQFAEDQPHLGLFNYARRGFRQMPTHHYMRPFWLAAHDSRLHALSSYLCLGPTPKHDLTLEYVERFAATYGARGIPFFAFAFLTEISHDFLNQVGAADVPLVEWLQKWRRSGLLNNTVLIVMSDHGNRFDGIRLTAVGRTEEHMPFCAVSLPEPYNRTHPTAYGNLAANAFRLTTPYDIHSALLQLARDDEDVQSQTGVHGTRFGRSVLTAISGNRTCDVAGVPPEYCTCQQEEDLPVKDDRTRTAANILMYKLNELTAPYRNICAELSLKSVHDAQHIKRSPEDHCGDSTFLTFHTRTAQFSCTVRVTVEAEPGNGLFEGLVQIGGDDSQNVVMRDISRVNAYGSQSKCLSGKELKKFNDLRKFCYCI